MELKYSKIGELCNVSSSKRVFAKQYVEEGIPFYRQKEIIDKKNGNALDEPIFISETLYNDFKEKFGVPVCGDLLITAVGATLGIPYVVDDEKFYFKDGNLIWLNNFKDDLDSNFLYYWIDSTFGTQTLWNRTIGSAQPALTIDSIKKLSIPIPSKDVQNKISSTLKTYDDLIANNNKRIKILEQMAENLYKEWFVRFRFPGYETVKFENGLPGGWKIAKLGTLCKIITGKKDANEATGRGAYPFFTCARETTLFTDEYILDTNAILISGNGSYTGLVKKYSGKFDLYQRTYALYDFQNIEWLYIYWTMKIDFEREFMGGSRGSAIPYITRPNIEKFKVIVPTKELLKKAQGIFEGIHNEVISLERQNINLAKQRDMLLPRLMSGKLEIKQSQEKVVAFKPKLTFAEFKNGFAAAARKDSGLTEQDMEELYKAYCDDSRDE